MRTHVHNHTHTYIRTYTANTHAQQPHKHYTVEIDILPQRDSTVREHVTLSMY